MALPDSAAPRSRWWITAGPTYSSLPLRAQARPKVALQGEADAKVVARLEKIRRIPTLKTGEQA